MKCCDQPLPFPELSSLGLLKLLAALIEALSIFKCQEPVYGWLSLWVDKMWFNTYFSLQDHPTITLWGRELCCLTMFLYAILICIGCESIWLHIWALPSCSLIAPVLLMACLMCNLDCYTELVLFKLLCSALNVQLVQLWLLHSATVEAASLAKEQACQSVDL